MKRGEGSQEIFAPALVLAVDPVGDARPKVPLRAHQVAADAQRRVLGTRHDDALKDVAQCDAHNEEAAGSSGYVGRAYGLGLAVGVGVSAGMGVAGPGVGVGVGGGGAVGPPVSGMIRR